LPFDQTPCDPAKNSIVLAWCAIRQLDVAGDATNAPDIDRGFDVRTPLMSGFSIGGDFAGTSASGVAYNKPPRDSVYRIGGDAVGYVFASPVDGDGQPNQLIVSALNDAPTTGIVGCGCVGVFHPDGPVIDDPLGACFPVTPPNAPSFDHPYDYLPQDWNDGAVGVVPFVEHHSSGDALNAGTTFASQFNRDCSGVGARDVLIDFYGPIKEKNSALPAPRVEMVVGGVPTGVDLSPRLDFDVAPDAFRVLNIRGKPGYGLPAGTSRVTRNSTTTDILLCDKLLSSADVPVSGELSCDFTLVQDCDCDGRTDMPGQSCNSGLCDPIDFNNDGVFPDNNDITTFLSVYSGGACPA
jgi:hypothetical protein